MNFDESGTFLGDHGHVRGGVLDGDDGLLLLGEDDASVQEWRHDVVDDQVDLGLAHLLKVLVEIRPSEHKNGLDKFPRLCNVVRFCKMSRMGFVGF